MDRVLRGHHHLCVPARRAGGQQAPGPSPPRRLTTHTEQHGACASINPPPFPNACAVDSQRFILPALCQLGKALPPHRPQDVAMGGPATPFSHVPLPLSAHPFDWPLARFSANFSSTTSYTPTERMVWISCWSVVHCGAARQRLGLCSAPAASPAPQAQRQPSRWLHGLSGLQNPFSLRPSPAWSIGSAQRKENRCPKRPYVSKEPSLVCASKALTQEKLPT